jgi:predicted alpha/beta-fold hydrolase
MSAGAFRPVPWLRGRHLETIVPSLWPVPAVAGAVEQRIVRVAPDAAVRVDVSRPEGAARGTLVLLHGMGGSARSAYVLRTARLALARGFAVARVNLRNCGGTEALSRTLYNAGQHGDVGAVLADLREGGFPRPIGVAGFSLGGNLVLLHAGKAGAAIAADTIVAVNPPVDLDACLRALERPENRVYQLHFLLGLCRQIRRIRRIREVPGPAASALRIGSIRRFDTLFTAPDAGYPSAEAYYAAASAGPHLSAIAAPSLIVSAGNDPFVPPGMFEPHRSSGSPSLRFDIPERGGHLGYWQRGSPRFWAGERIVRALEALA